MVKSKSVVWVLTHLLGVFVLPRVPSCLLDVQASEFRHLRPKIPVTPIVDGHVAQAATVEPKEGRMEDARPIYSIISDLTGMK